MHRVWVALWIVPMLFQKYLSIIFHKFCSATAVCQYEQHVSVWIRNALSDQKSPALDTDTRVGVGLCKMRDLQHNYLSPILSFCEGNFRQKMFGADVLYHKSIYAEFRKRYPTRYYGKPVVVVGSTYASNTVYISYTLYPCS